MKQMFVIAALVLLITGCKENKNQSKNTSNILVIKGSDTELIMVKDLAEAYKKEHPEVTIEVTGGGTGHGIEALINHETEIANASREMKESEFERARKNGFQPMGIMFSVDALAIITNSKLGIDSLSTEQLSQIFSGEISNWKDFGGPDLPIHLYGRDSTSGTYSYFKDKFVKNNYSTNMLHLDGNASIVKAVQNDLGGIGYAGAGYLMDINGKPNGNIWAMPIYLIGSRAYSPYESEAVIKGDYVLTRPLYQYLSGLPGQKIYEFIMFELTKRGQSIVRKHGYFPINDYQQEINRLSGYHNYMD